MHIIHIGAPKTASTFLQARLDSAAPRLRELGVCLPPEGWARGRGHFDFRMSLRPSADNDPHYIKLREQFRERFLREPNTVLSAETLWTVKPENILQCYPELKDAKIIMVCRSQRDMIMSHFFQKVKGGRIHCTLMEFLERERNQYDFLQKIQTWEAVFGTGSVCPLLYEKMTNEGGIGTHFCQEICQILGLSFSEDDPVRQAFQETGKKANARLNPLTYATILAVARSGVSKEVREQVRKAILQNPEILPDFQPSPLLPYDAFWEKLDSFYAQSNQRLFETYWSHDGSYKTGWPI